MKTIQLISIAIIIFLLKACYSFSDIGGKYSYIPVTSPGGQMYTFSKDPNKFEYYFKIEGSVIEYSTGTWEQDGKIIILNGFDEKNLNVLNIVSQIKNCSSISKNNIRVKYNESTLDTFTKVDIIINGNTKVPISADTVFFADEVVRTLLVKTYLSHYGYLLRTPYLIDTLYSPEIIVGDEYPNKKIFLSININRDDFYRIPLVDTLTIMNKNTLLKRNYKFKKIRK